MDKMSANVRYTKPQIALHNLMALLVIGLYLFGLSLESFPKEIRGTYVNFHKLGGLLLVLLLLARVALRSVNPPPPFPASMSASFAKFAHLGHFALYALMAIVPALGISLSLAAGRGVNFYLFQLNSPFEANKALASQLIEAHEFAAHALIIVAAGHLLVALYHQFVLKDNLLSRLDPRVR
jgi:cytochrome b561